MKVAALFPGQGSQAVGMGRALHEASPAAREVLTRADATLPGLLELMFEGPAEALTSTANQQPALVAAGVAAFAAWREAGGPVPVVTAGHSLGEYTAHVAAGSLPLEDALRLVRARGRFMQEAVPAGVGAMAAVLKLNDDTVQRLCDDAHGGEDAVVEIANRNAPGQVVVSGHAGPVAAVAQAAKAAGGRAVPLKVSAPFHCRLMRPAAERLWPLLQEAPFAAPAFPLVCTVDAQPLARPDAARERLRDSVTGAVLWTGVLGRIEAEHAPNLYLEFGSGAVLTGLLGRTLQNAQGRAVADPEGLRAALAQVRPEREGSS